MKLTKSQIEALAFSIEENFREKAVVEKNQLLEKELENFKPTFNKTQGIFKKYPDVQSVTILYSGHDIKICRTNDLLDFMKEHWIFNEVIKDKLKPRPSQYAIEREIILSTIDAKSVDEIVKKVTNKFK